MRKKEEPLNSFEVPIGWVDIVCAVLAIGILAFALIFAYQGIKLSAAKARGDIRAANADERIAAADERMADALERAYPPHLPRPSLLLPTNIKPIPEPDPEPCVSEQEASYLRKEDKLHAWLCNDYRNLSELRLFR